MAGNFTYTIGGVRVVFPCKPYPSQMSMMDKIMKGVERHQNCLLESPTGSGKSLALLCSVLAWQEAEKAKLRRQEEEEENGKKSGDTCCNCGGSKNRTMTSANQMPTMIINAAENANATLSNLAALGTEADPIDLEDEDDDFKPNKKQRTRPGNKREPVKIEYEEAGAGASRWTMEVQPSASSLADGNACCCSCADNEGDGPKKKVPKIFFGTRTHKQIAQITHELRRTAYKHVNMTILASREHTCIDPEVSTMSKKNEECKNKLDGPGCRFKDNVPRINHGVMNNCDMREAWDLEDFVGYSRKLKACPYFGTRQLRETADIVFCPYNYLIDPIIRNSMEINLKGQVVILDEAHNIEDASREAASFSVNQKQLLDAAENLQHLVEMRQKPTEHDYLRNVCLQVGHLIHRCEGQLEGNNFDQVSKVWMGMEMLVMLKEAGVGPEKGTELMKAFMEIATDEQDPRKREMQIKASSPTLSLLEGLLVVLEYVYRADNKYLMDYRMAVVRNIAYDEMNTHNVWLNGRRGNRQIKFVYSLNFWCMNPAVAFSDIGGVARSIVLTSGTLSPMTSFASELDVPFPIQLEASHVIGKSQVWVGTISKGPCGRQLLGSYQTAETFAYQDEVGGVILEVCQTIPHGVLCFVSSYNMLNKLKTRWQDTGIFEQINCHKKVLCEPRASEKVDFDDLLLEFYDAIRRSEDTENNPDGQTGALFMAVCRGKVSEGLDFADNNARAVITVGIPFPSIKDSQVDLKKKYNNMHVSRGLLNGGAWYEIQAYRAMNQALGRCIRHRMDWGALILVDERFAKNPKKYISGLSKWVRQHVQYFSTFQQAQHSLKDFTDRRQEIGRINPADVSAVPVDPDMTLPAGQLDTTSKAPFEFKTPLAQRNISFTNHQSNASATTNHQSDTPVKAVPTSKSTPTRNAFHALMPQAKPATKTKPPQPSTSVPSKVDLPANMSPDPRFFSASQAGGFLPTQIDQSATAAPASQPMDLTIDEGHGGMDETVLEGSLGDSQRPDSQRPALDLNLTAMDLDFKPPLASTQAPAKTDITPLKSTHGRSTPLKTAEKSTPNKPTNGEPSLASKLSKFAFKSKSPPNMTPKKSDDMDSSLMGNAIHDVSPSKSGAGTAKPVTPCVKSEPERAESPPLFFDSADFDDDPDYIPSSDTKSKKQSRSLDIKQKPVLDFGGTPQQKPLFKTSKSKQLNDDACDDFDINTSGTQSTRKRLSRRGRSSLNNSTLSQMVPENDDKNDVSNSKTVKKTLKKDESVSKEDEFFLGENDLENDGEELKVKRRGGNKRRREASGRGAKPKKKNKGIMYDEPENVEILVNCQKCGQELFVKDCEPREELFMPKFLESHACGKTTCLVTDSADIAEDCWVTTTCKGVELNSHWSAPDQCCVRYMCCSQCQDLIVGAQVCATAAVHGKYRYGQIWLLQDKIKMQ